MPPRRDRPPHKKRANGEGTVFWHAGKKRWASAVIGPDGRKKRLYSKTEVEARKKLRHMLTAVERGEPLGRDDLTLARFLTEIFLPVDDKRQPLPHALMKGKPSHVARTEGIIRQHIVPCSIANVRLSRLRPLDIQQWRDTKLAEISPKTKKPNSPTSVRLMQVTLQGALKHAVRLEFIARNPAELVPLPAASDFEGSAWEPDEAMRFLDVCVGHRLENLFTLALLTGMREGELLGLRWADIHWSATCSWCDPTSCGSAELRTMARRSASARSDRFPSSRGLLKPCGDSKRGRRTSVPPPEQTGTTSTWSSPTTSGIRSTPRRSALACSIRS
jgi:integrase